MAVNILPPPPEFRDTELDEPAENGSARQNGTLFKERSLVNADMEIDRLIKSIPPEIQEKILAHLLETNGAIRNRRGWKKIHEECKRSSKCNS